MTVEKPVRNSDSCCSCTMPLSAAASTSAVTGSSAVVAAMSIPLLYPFQDQVAVTVDADRLAGQHDRRRVELLDDGRPLEGVARLQPRPVVDRAGYRAAQL